MRDTAIENLANGIDPSLQKRLDRIEAENKARIIFKAVADEYYQNQVDHDLAPSTLRKMRWHIDDLAKSLHDRPINQITAAELLNLLKKTEKNSAQTSAGSNVKR